VDLLLAVLHLNEQLGVSGFPMKHRDSCRNTISSTFLHDAIRHLRGMSRRRSSGALFPPVLVGGMLEAVAHAGSGDEIAGPPRIGFELLPQLGQVDAEVVGLGAVVRAPYRGKEPALGDEPR
jgi:hypothetical protein